LNFIWIGTDDGLNRYDGYNFVIYKHLPGNENTLSNSSINSILEDRKGNLWIGTSEGLNLFDRENDCFIHPSNWPKQSILTIAENEEGNLWIGTDNGLYYYNLKLDSFKLYRPSISGEGKISSGRIQSILIDRTKNVWIGTSNGLNLFDKRSDSFINFSHQKDNPNSLGGNGVRALIEDETGRLWIGNTSGLDMMLPIEKNPDKAIFKHYQYNPYNKKGITEGTVLSLLEDRKNQKLWIGVENGCLNMIDLKEINESYDNFSCYCSDPTKLYSLSNNSVYSLFKDKQGNIWIGTWGNGINIISIAREKFTLYRTEPFNTNSLINNHVNTFFDDNDFLWIGTEGGLERFNKKNRTFKHYIHNPIDKTTIGSNAIVTINKDAMGTLWVGGWNSGLNRFNYKNESFTRYYRGPNDISSVDIKHVFAINPAPNGNLWLGTIYNGLILFKPDSGIVENFNPANSDITSNYVEAIMQAKDGSFWLSSNVSLDRFDPKTKTFFHFRPNPNDSASIKSNMIFSMNEDSKGNIWIGTNAGLHLYNKATNGFKTYLTNDGLPDNSIKSINEDNRGNLWLGTNKGLSEFINGTTTPAKPIFKNFTIEDGLQGNEFWRNSSYKSPEGLMYFGGTNGFNVFNPDSITETNHIINVVFVDFLVFNKPVSIDEKDSPIKQSISLADEITLNHAQSVFSFRYVAINYISPQKTQYAYMMEGFEEKWNYVGERREATYTNLDPGEYTFKVKANNNGIWYKKIASIKVIILPPWWQTLWFRILTFFAFATSIVLFYYLRLAMYRKKEKELSELVHQRTIELTDANKILFENKLLMEEHSEELLAQSENLKTTNDLLVQKQELIKLQADTIQDTNVELRKLNSTKDRILSIIGHDLRNPFNVVSGFSDLLLEDFNNLSPETIEMYLLQISQSSKNGNILLGNLLQWSRTQAGGITFEPIQLNLLLVVKDTFDFLGGDALKKKIGIHLQIEQDVNIIADENMLKTILRNLLSNALKFTPENGSISITSTLNSEYVEVCISDSGVGIPKEKIPLLFKIETNISTKGTSNETGTGLGLILCKEFVEKHQGKIWVESEIGIGTQFKFILPLM